MAFPIRKLEERCTSQQRNILYHIFKIKSYPEHDSVNHWIKEVRDFLNSTLAQYKTKVKPDKVNHWLYGELSEKRKSSILDNMKEDMFPNFTPLVYENLNLDEVYSTLSTQVSDKCNKGLPEFTTNDIKKVLDS